MKRKLLTSALLCSMGLSFLSAQVFQSWPIQSGFNADVIANGVGPSASSTNFDVDGVNYNFISKDFQPTSASPVLTYGLPINGEFTSGVSTTPNLPYKLANYTGNNSLRLSNSSTSGTLTLATPAAAYRLFLLTTSGSGASTVNIVVNFADGTSQTFTGISIADWFGGSNFAISGFGRVLKTTDAVENPTGNPRLYQTTLAIDAANQSKLIQSVTVTKTSTTNTFPNIFAISADAVVSCAPPTSVTASAVYFNTATISWTAPATAPGSYEVYYSTANVAPDASTVPSLTGITGTSANLTGLTPNTTYYVWVRSNCGTPGPWGSTGMNFYTGYCMPSTDNQSSWISSFTSTGASINMNYNSSAGAAGGYQDLTASHKIANYAGSITPISLTAGGPTCGFAIWVDWNNNMVFEASERVFVTSVYVTSISGTIEAPSTAALGNYRMRVVTNYNNSVPSNPCAVFTRGEYIDYTYEIVPATGCNTPTNLINSATTPTSASFTWNVANPVPANGYEVYYALSGSPAPTSATAASFTGIAINSFTLTGLTPGTSYCLWVRSNCGAGSQSGWSQSSCFTTSCLATNVPYTQNFESATVPSLPDCTIVQNAGTGNNWVTADVSQYGFNSRVLNYKYHDTNSANTWFYTQGLNLTAGVTYTVSYKYGNNSVSAYTEKMKVAYGTSPNAASMVNTIADYPAINGSAAQTASVDFVPATTGVYYFGFNAYSAPNQYYLYLDDISVIQKQLATAEVAMKKVTVSPNPFKDFIRISEVKNVKSLSVFDVSGRTLKMNIKPAEYINLSDLKTGVYILNIHFEDGKTESHKLIKN